MDDEIKWEPVEPLIDSEEFSRKMEDANPDEVVDEETRRKEGVYSEAMRRHHDYYLDESRRLSPEDQPNIDLALERERSGKIKR